MKKNSNIRILIFYLLLIVAVIVSLSLVFRQRTAQPKEVEYGEVIEYFEKDAVIQCSVSNDNVLTMQVYDHGSDV